VSDPFLAEIRVSPYNFAQRGWAFCAGQILPISQNTALFSLIGTIYGGNGTSNFGLPDMQSRVAVDVGQGQGLSPYELGQMGGVENVTLQAQELGPHTHPASCFNANGNQYQPQNGVWAQDAGLNPQYGSVKNSATMAANIIGRNGGGGPHNNIQPYLALNYCIALAGVYPPRP
jgi:microcystin-dependent protein